MPDGLLRIGEKNKIRVISSYRKTTISFLNYIYRVRREFQKVCNEIYDLNYRRGISKNDIEGRLAARSKAKVWSRSAVASCISTHVDPVMNWLTLSTPCFTLPECSRPQSQFLKLLE